MDMKSILFVAFFGTLVLVGKSEKVEDRVNEALELLSEQCRTNLRQKATSGICTATDDIRKFRFYSERSKACYTRNRETHRACFQHASCKVDETNAFFEKLCDFKMFNNIRSRNGLIMKFSPECKREFNKCLIQVKTSYFLKREDYCSAFKEDEELEECFEDIGYCDNDEDEDNFDKIVEVACSQSSVSMYSLAVLLGCLGLTRYHL